MKIILSILAICFILQSGNAQNYLICQQASNVSNITSEIQPPVREEPSNTGKRGPPGLPGPPGVCDPEKIIELENELLNLKEQEQELVAKLRIMTDKLECIGGVIFEGFCYKLLYTSGSFMAYNGALNLCVYRGGNMATIWSLPMYNTLYEYIQKEWNVVVDEPTIDYTQVWLNMLYKDGELTFQENGLKSSFVQWYPVYPRATAGHVNIALTIATRRSRGKSNTGMFNTSPSGSTAVPLCRFDINH